MNEISIWLKAINEYPLSMIEMLMDASPDDWQEVTVPTPGDRVILPDGEEGEVRKVDGDSCMIVADNGEIIEVKSYSVEVIVEDRLPISGMWSFDKTQVLENEWLETEQGVYAMCLCGFRIFHHAEWGHFFGIDGGNYSFLMENWVPLYNAKEKYRKERREKNRELLGLEY